MDRFQLKIGGMSCGHCVKMVESALSSVEGIKVVNVELASAEIECPTAIVKEAVESVIEAGYKASVADV